MNILACTIVEDVFLTSHKICVGSVRNELSRSPLPRRCNKRLFRSIDFQEIHHSNRRKQIQSDKLLVRICCLRMDTDHFMRCRSGRWRSEYRIDLESSKVEGKILVNVHYYEQGNVSLDLRSQTYGRADRYFHRFNSQQLTIPRSTSHPPYTQLRRSRLRKPSSLSSRTKRVNTRYP